MNNKLITYLFFAAISVVSSSEVNLDGGLKKQSPNYSPKKIDASKKEDMNLLVSPVISANLHFQIKDYRNLIDVGLLFDISNPIYIIGYNKLLSVNILFLKTLQSHIELRALTSTSIYSDLYKTGIALNLGVDFVRNSDYWGKIFSSCALELNLNNLFFSLENKHLLFGKSPFTADANGNYGTARQKLEDQNLTLYLTNKSDFINFLNFHSKFQTNKVDVALHLIFKNQDFLSLKFQEMDAVIDFIVFLSENVIFNYSIGYSNNFEKDKGYLLCNLKFGYKTKTIKSKKIRDRRSLFLNKLPLKYVDAGLSIFQS